MRRPRKRTKLQVRLYHQKPKKSRCARPASRSQTRLKLKRKQLHQEKRIGFHYIIPHTQHPFDHVTTLVRFLIHLQPPKRRQNQLRISLHAPFRIPLQERFPNGIQLRLLYNKHPLLLSPHLALRDLIWTSFELAQKWLLTRTQMFKLAQVQMSQRFKQMYVLGSVMY